MPHPHAPRDPRAARLEARLALYAQYASLVGDEVAAAWSGDPAQAGALTRELAEERRAIATRYAALGDWAEQAPLTPAAFGTVLAGAVTERDHHEAVNRALRDRLESLQASGWIPTGGATAVRALPAGSPEDAPSTEAPAGGTSGAAGESLGALPPEMGGALVAARSSGVGGVLGGRYPGVVAGADAADYVAGAALGGASAAEGTIAARVDVRL